MAKEAFCKEFGPPGEAKEYMHPSGPRVRLSCILLEATSSRSGDLCEKKGGILHRSRSDLLSPIFLKKTMVLMENNNTFTSVAFKNAPARRALCLVAVPSQEPPKGREREAEEAFKALRG